MNRKSLQVYIQHFFDLNYNYTNLRNGAKRRNGKGWEMGWNLDTPYRKKKYMQPPTVRFSYSLKTYVIPLKVESCWHDYIALY